MEGIILKAGREKAVKQRHHWIFSGAIATYSDFEDGALLPIYSSQNELLGTGYFNRNSSIFGRLISFGAENPLTALKRQLDRAIAMRENFFHRTTTNAYRLVNGEGDGIPGLVIDQYDRVLVIQISTLGMEKLKEWLLPYLIDKLSPVAIYEKSLLPSRKEEGLKPFQGCLYGQLPDTLVIKENDLKFRVSIVEGQKTGFFLDHREMRKQVGQLAKGKRVLNCFCYTGAFSVYASHGGAKEVTSVDISESAIEMTRHNLQLNQLQGKAHVADVFEFLREESLDYQLVILDPPAFAKKKKDIISACRGYKDINRVAMQKMPAGSLLLTSSCSYYVDANLFQKVLFQAALEAGRQVKIIGYHQLAYDHPINIYHPEGDYLKSLLLYIE